ncbi:YheC/YheD family endospore coat-associated protein [Litchfieldia alkalitelluris]|uniref:YheC/YheD family endospore coat-associated protein n=1 Tax=Litchfieldia alkalitelluris TaxID=304268 RepID=UPI0009974FA7|nr:YheC/YheD family protein [Litchfieldia alkalitelluris]
MICLYYDPSTKKWAHNEIDQDLRWGKFQIQIPYSGSISNNMLPFFLSSGPHGKFIPIIGILAADSKNKSAFFGNAPKFIRLQEALKEKGALSIVITPSSLNDQEVNGFYYLKPINKWIRITIPFPNVIYNRIPFRKMEKEPAFHSFSEIIKEKKVLFFNPFFFSKWEVYTSLLKHSKLSSHLPVTKPYSAQALQDFLKDYDSVYIKANKGHKGEGIYRVSKKSTQILLSTIRFEQRFESLTYLQRYLNDTLKNNDYIIQESIQSDTFESKRYDLRILAHKGQNSHYKISGIGIRLSGSQDVTTHIPNGGSMIDKVHLEDKINMDVVEEIINAIGQQLSTDFKGLIGEFSVDLGKSVDGNYYIYEVNSKPMVFDEPEIKKRGLDNLANLLLQLTQVKE